MDKLIETFDLNNIQQIQITVPITWCLPKPNSVELGCCTDSNIYSLKTDCYLKATSLGCLCPSCPAQGTPKSSLALVLFCFCTPHCRGTRLLPPNRKSVPCGPAGSCLCGLPEKAGTGRPQTPPAAPGVPAAPTASPARCLEQSAHSSDGTHLQRATLGGRGKQSPEGAGSPKSWCRVHN